MTIKDAIGLIEQLLERGKLTKAQEAVFSGTWAGKTYTQIAASADYDNGHIKDVGAEQNYKRILLQNCRSLS